MKKLKVTVTKILGECTSTPPMEKGDFFTVDNGDLRIPPGRFVCVWALQSLLPLIPAKERKIGERRADDWMWRVHHVQCPDPKGRVVFKIEKDSEPGAVRKGSKKGASAELLVARVSSSPFSTLTRPLRVVVDEVKGKCTSGLRKGDGFFVDGCRLTIPAGRHFCLYALQAVLPFIAAKERPLADGDWLKRDDRFICPDPAGNVVLRVEVL